MRLERRFSSSLWGCSGFSRRVCSLINCKFAGVLPEAFYLGFAAEIFARALERRVDAGYSAVDGISTAVVLCLQSGKVRGQTPQQRGMYFLRGRCKDAWIRLLAEDAVAGVR
jgi:hypothetical protein